MRHPAALTKGQAMATATLSPSPSPATSHGRSGARILVGLILGIPAVIALMLLAFAAPALHSGPSNLPLAVSGPPPAVAQVTGMLQQRAPGTFEVTTYASAEDAAVAIGEREAIGGIAVGPTGVTIQTAAGAGAPYSALLKGMGAQLTQTDQHVTYTELALLPSGDPAGTGLTTLGLPLIFGGMATATALVLVYRGSTRARIGGLLAVSIVGGFVATAILAGFGALDGNVLLVSAAVAAGIAAVSATVVGLGSSSDRRASGSARSSCCSCPTRSPAWRPARRGCPSRGARSANTCRSAPPAPRCAPRPTSTAPAQPRPGSCSPAGSSVGSCSRSGVPVAAVAPRRTQTPRADRHDLNSVGVRCPTTGAHPHADFGAAAGRLRRRRRSRILRRPPEGAPPTQHQVLFPHAHNDRG